MKKIKLTICLLLPVIITGCWYYSFTDMPYSNLETVAFIPFENLTTEYDIAENLGLELLSELENSGLFKIENKNPDATLYGTITRFERYVNTYTSSDIPEEYRLTIQAKVTLKDMNKDKILWERTFEGVGTYKADEDDSQARIEANSKLIENIMQKVREG